MKIQATKSTLAFCILHFAFSIYSNAQIVYTNIPDVGLKCHSSNCLESYSLDLNSDGTSDFTINASAYSSIIEYCPRCPSYNNHVYINPLNGNGVAVLALNNYPAAFVLNNEIGPSLTWENVPITSFTLTQTFCGCAFSQCFCSLNGNWTTNKDRYIGLSLIVNNQTYYGWVRVSATTSSKNASCKILDFGYESTPGQPILAGATGSAMVANPSIGNSPEEGTAPSKINVNPNPVSSDATISFTLLHKEKVALNLYDISGRIVNKLGEKEFNEGTHQIILNTKDLKAGIYLLRLQSQSGVKSKKIIVLK